MAMPSKFAALLMLTSALTPAAALAQTDSPAPAAPASDAPASAPEASPDVAPAAAPDVATADPAEEQAAPDVSIPGGDIVVVGTRNSNIQKSAPAVVSVLSAADIQRTGEGNIAGALGRVTGLSVVGSGFVYVRGLGDRYSLALLNGSPLPSPEPLKRSIPLDLFPTNIIASSLVQKSYSVNFPGEFGGGVINLTTNAVPKESFLTIGGGVGYNSETTGRLGYDYRGAGSDWTGFDNGRRNLPTAVSDYFKSGRLLQSLTPAENRAIAGSLITPQLSIVQRWGHVAPNFSANVTGGTNFDLGGDSTLGLIATAGYSSRWQTRDALQQASVDSDLAQLSSNFQRVTTTNRVVVNGLLGVGLEFGDNKARATGLYIRDTLKSTRFGLGSTQQLAGQDILSQDTAWYERQLIDMQTVVELKPTEQISVDLRGGYANSQREAPAETRIDYGRTGDADTANLFFNDLNRVGRAVVNYSDLNEDLWSAGADVTYRPIPDVRASAGYAFQYTSRSTSLRSFAFKTDNNDAIQEVRFLRPDILFSPGVINAANPDGSNRYAIFVFDNVDASGTIPQSFRSRLLNHAGYGKINWQVTPEVLIDGGVRYEWAREDVRSIQIFSAVPSQLFTNLQNHYWLPAATATWQFRPDMQLRANFSKTIARPQFRELVSAQYFDPETNRLYKGNSALTDSELTNAEIRYEWYFARDQRIALAGFYKRINRPIEAFQIAETDNSLTTSYANAPKADLYGGEFEVQKYFDASAIFSDAFFETRRLLLTGNYTYTKSKLKVGVNDTTAVAGTASTLATDYFRDGSPLTGQSDHLINLQLGLEDTDKLSQQTLILSYASRRATSRGVRATGQPDVFEYPGFNLDFVWRQGIDVFKRNLDLKFEVRNITNNKYREYQESGNRRVYYNLYRPGATFSFSVSSKF